MALPETLQDTAQQLLYRLRMEEPVEDLIAALAGADDMRLQAETKSDAEKKAFWINLYNSFNLYFMQRDPKIGAQRSARMRHFVDRKITVAGQKLSLNDIEHGILRRSMAWWSLGYLGKIFVSSFERMHRVEKLDPRIHFALNCGAVSCPPIRFYTPEGIDNELQIATTGFTMTEVKLDGDKVMVSGIFRLYIGDFGGKSGLRRFLRRFRDDLPKGTFRIGYLKYDWTTELDAFA